MSARAHPLARRTHVVVALLIASSATACGTPTTPSAPVSSAAKPDSSTSAQMTPARRERLPNGDRDGDDVVNAMDECPDLAEDLDRLRDEDGCPEEDADEDGTPDVSDPCPMERGGPRPEPGKTGCPYVDRFRPGPAEIRILERVYFAYGDATTLTADAKRLLDQLAQVLKENPELRKIDVRGHASSDEPAPDDLGVKRATKVRDELVSRGVDAVRLTTSSLGSKQPRSDDKTVAGRTDNRRVEFEITEQVIYE